MLAAFFAALAVSAIRPYDYFTWFLEVVPALIALPVLLLTYKRFRLTDLLYTFIFVHAMVLIIGGHFTYAREPLFSWVRGHFDLSRNYYDRVGHFMQGFVPALVAREVFIRQNVVKRGRWMFVIVLSVCMGVSAVYELFEWSVAVATGTAAGDFLGTQGDPWDTQEDMATCFVGAFCALMLASKIHDHAIGRLATSPVAEAETQPAPVTPELKSIAAATPEPVPAPTAEIEIQPEPEPAALPVPEHILKVRPAVTAQDIADVRQLFVEYGQSLGFSLAFQSFDQEFAALPGKYASPRGRLFLAEVDGKAAGCIALRPLETGVCEMKRLFIRPEFRGLKLGRQLVEVLIAEAKEIGYHAMRLDTIDGKMQAAIELYRSVGFQEITPYAANPVEGARFMQLELAPVAQLSLYGG